MNDMTVVNTRAREAIETLQIFDGVSEAVLDKIANKAGLTDVVRGEAIFREHDSGNTVYFVLQGSVGLAIHRPEVGLRQITELGPGELLGWSPLLKQPRLTATARAQEPTTLLTIPAEALLQLCEDDHDFCGNFMSRVAEVIAERLRATRVQLLERSGLQLPKFAMESD